MSQLYIYQYFNLIIWAKAIGIWVLYEQDTGFVELLNTEDSQIFDSVSVMEYIVSRMLCINSWYVSLLDTH
jgi:hypothetical protein